MRVLLVAAPLIGHAFPFVPLGRALQAAGHDVLVATGGEALSVADAGLPVHDIAGSLSIASIAMPIMLRHPVIARAELAGRAGTRGVGLLFGALNSRLAGPAVELAESWHPDLVLHEPLAIAGSLAAAAVGAPAVLHENTLFDARTLVRETLSRMGATVPEFAGVISSAPPSVLPGRESSRPMRAVPYGGTGSLPILPESGRPLIAVSRSTVAGPGRERLMERVAAAAPGVDADFLLIRPARQFDVPPNVYTSGWVSIPQLLGKCAAIVHHGGAGTTLAALHAGVPQLVINGAGDRRHNAGLIAARGAGLAADEPEIDANTLTLLITDPSLAAAAGEVRDEMAAMPAPEALVPWLASLPHG
ncbi:MAG TPA: nucleotide disphospho-sugar-binding domain-containing protein [Dactylosporangium sp.]|jgi:UDP:flavonoid glycosyltransferase YjiC (YdhE family)|nr:nucleotide disphospho-sugar-binding domain-containing protein [Dactylosporangium sp.]